MTGHANTLRVATWNLERAKPHGWKIAPAQRRRMQEVDADIWVLTETHLDYAPSPDHSRAVYSAASPDRHPDPERWTAIWSRWDLEEITDPPSHWRGTAAAVASTPFGDVVVYGTVIPYHGERSFSDGRPARSWEVHHAEIDRQSGEWRQLRERYPDLPMVIAGDFNQDRDGSGWYGTTAGRSALTSHLDRAGLSCVTDVDVVAAGLLQNDHLVDHICADGELASKAELLCWEKHDHVGQRLSDHPTVAVDFRFG